MNKAAAKRRIANRTEEQQLAIDVYNNSGRMNLILAVGGSRALHLDELGLINPKLFKYESDTMELELTEFGKEYITELNKRLY